jgi:hypothetical protein
MARPRAARSYEPRLEEAEWNVIVNDGAMK